MKPVMQSKFGAGEGDCLPACIASLMGLELSEVPNFADEGTDTWIWAMHRWLGARGWGLVVLPAGSSWFAAGCPGIGVFTVAESTEHHAMVVDNQWGTSGEGTIRSAQYVIHNPNPKGNTVLSLVSVLLLVPPMPTSGEIDLDGEEVCQEAPADPAAVADPLTGHLWVCPKCGLRLGLGFRESHTGSKRCARIAAKRAEAREPRQERVGTK